MRAYSTYLTKINAFIKQSEGAVAIILAMFFPIYLSFCAVAVDMSLAYKHKARLSDGINEGLLAVAAVNNSNESIQDTKINRALVNHYVNAYLPNQIKKESDLMIKSDVDTAGNRRYAAVTSVKLKTIFPFSVFGSVDFGQNNELAVANKGIVIKQPSLKQPVPTDLVFVVDVSRSMQQKTIPDGSKRRITAVQEAVQHVIDSIQEPKPGDPPTTLGLVPYDIGVPVDLNDAKARGCFNGNIERELGNQTRIGCSVIFIPKKEYKVNYHFWANKYVPLQQKYILPGSGNGAGEKFAKEAIKYTIEKTNNQYFTNIVLPALSCPNGKCGNHYPDENDLVKAGLCEKVAPPYGPLTGNDTLSCWPLKEDRKYAYSQSNSKAEWDRMINAEYDNLMRTLTTMRSRMNSKNNELGYRSIANIETIDFDATIRQTLFTHAGIQIFAQPWAPNLEEYRPFGEMCESATGLIDQLTPTENVVKEPDGYEPNKVVTIAQANEVASSTFKTGKQQVHVIELTTDYKKIVDQLKLVSDASQSRAVGGGSDTVNALMRALPEVNRINARTKTRKLVIITDAFDSDPYESQEHLQLADTYINKHGLCKAIREVRLQTIHGEPVTFDMYFVSLSAKKQDNQAEYNLWRNCVGPENMFEATDVNQLVNVLNNIMSTETGYFVSN